MAHLFRPRLLCVVLLLAEILNEIMKQSDVLGAGGIDPTSPHAHRTMGRQFTRVTGVPFLSHRCAPLAVGVAVPATLNQSPLPVTVGHPSVVIAHLWHSGGFSWISDSGVLREILEFFTELLILARCRRNAGRWKVNYSRLRWRAFSPLFAKRSDTWNGFFFVFFKIHCLG